MQVRKFSQLIIHKNVFNIFHPMNRIFLQLNQIEWKIHVFAEFVKPAINVTMIPQESIRGVK
jgi:hypothetical protein